jgi:hypothetical protein
MTSTNVPDWQTFEGGSRSRVALWLYSQVGSGRTFTKANLREAFPGVEQVDRRMRDLRTAGWVIETYQIDRSLAPDELRLTKIGGRVWEKNYRSKSSARPSAKERQAALLADGFACVSCGIGGGETFPDDPLRLAKLSAARRPDVDDQTYLVTQCDRCLAAQTFPDLAELKAKVEQLDPISAAELERWMKDGKGRPRPIDVIWGQYRGLGRNQQADLEQLVSKAAEHGA